MNNPKLIDGTKPLQTKSGLPFELVTTKGRGLIYPVLGYVGESCALSCYTSEGREFREDETDLDLMNVPDPDELTEWFGADTVPFHVGEYNASMRLNEDLRRWFDGTSWSEEYLENDSPDLIEFMKNIKAVYQNLIKWRGLKNKPEVTK